MADASRIYRAGPANWQARRPGPGAGWEGANWGLLPAGLFALGGLWAPAAHAGPAAAFALLASLMACYDLACRRIPNPLTALTALWGLAWALAVAGPAGLLTALGGGLTAFAIMTVFFLLGAMGAGDVKAMAALAVFLSPWGAVELFMLVALCGGALAVGRALAARSLAGLRGLELPYGVAIWAGAMALLLARGGSL